MKSFYLFILLFFFSAPFLHGQSNYKPGYVVNLKNDTLRGYIDYREWSNTPKEISFKQEPDQKAQKFSSRTANAFAINNAEYFEKFIVSVSKGETESSKLENQPDTTYSIDTIFLKNIVTGNHIALYSYKDAIKTRYYVLNRHTKQIDELKQLQYIGEDGRTIVTINSFRTQLLRLAAVYKPGNEKLTFFIQKSRYTDNDLLNVVKTINDNTNQLVVHKSPFGIRVFAGAGVRSSKLTFKGEPIAFPDGTSKSAISPTISGGLDILTNKNTERLVIRVEFTFVSNHFNISSPVIPGISSKLDFKQFTSSFIPQIIYNVYSTDKFKAFINTGVAFSFSSYNDYNYVINYNNISTSSKKKFPDFDSNLISIPLKVGVQVNKRIEIYGSYWLPALTASYVYSSMKLSAYQAGVNFLFGK